MRTHRKPDLLFLLALFVGFGVVVSSYIQYSRAHPSVTESSSLEAREKLAREFSAENQLIQVSSEIQPVSAVNGDTVNNSLPRP